MNYKIAKTIGLNTDQKASQVIYSFCNEDNVFMVVLTLEGDDAFVSGRQLLSDLVDSFCEKEESVGEKLTSSFEETRKNLEGRKFSLLLAAVSTKVLYLVGTNSVSAVLKRGNNISTLLENGSEQLISGFLEEGDKVFLATQPLSIFLGGNLQNSLRLSLEEWEDEMAVRLNEQEVESGSMAGLILEVEQPASTQDEYQENIVPISTSEEEMKVNSMKQILYHGLNFLPKNGRIKLLLAGIIILIVTVGLIIKFISVKSEQQSQEVVRLLEQARSAKGEAETLKGLNAVEAEKKLKEASSLVDQALKLKSNNPDAVALKKVLEDASAGILQKFSQAQLSEFIDLASSKSGFKGEEINLLSKRIVVLGGSLIHVDVDKKNAQVLVEKDGLGDSREVVLTEDSVYVYSKDLGVTKVDLGSKKTSSVISSDDGWGAIKSIGVFGGNIYLLDTKDQVWKYIPTPSGFSSKRTYFTTDTKVKLSDALDLQIDSSVYILKQNGEILKFTKGAKDEFSLVGLDKSLKDPKAIFVSPDTENLYVLDSGNSRVVVLSKTGSYKAQYEADKLGVASDIVVDEKGKKIYILEGSKIYSMELK